jgi:hypothetical protein
LVWFNGSVFPALNGNPFPGPGVFVSPWLPCWAWWRRTDSGGTWVDHPVKAMASTTKPPALLLIVSMLVWMAGLSLSLISEEPGLFYAVLSLPFAVLFGVLLGGSLGK